jgi:hypothetical protein
MMKEKWKPINEQIFLIYSLIFFPSLEDQSDFRRFKKKNKYNSKPMNVKMKNKVRDKFKML